jgi:hypothetical protein
MRAGYLNVRVTLPKEENEQLKSFANSQSLPYKFSKRARLILMAAEETPKRAIAQKIELSSQMVSKGANVMSSENYRASMM